jgi:3-oxoacyl-[acyl-carrier protein] reductase
LIEKIIEQENQIDFFVSAIGYYNPNTYNTFAEYKRNMLINLDIPTEISLVVLEHMKSNESGTIVFISSEAAIGGSRTLGYSASKAGLEGVRKFMALETAKSKVRVFSVAPGITDTKMAAQANWERQNSTIMRTYEQRMGQPEEIAELVLFLLTKAPDYMKGQCISIDNGLASRYR